MQTLTNEGLFNAALEFYRNRFNKYVLEDYHYHNCHTLPALRFQLPQLCRVPVHPNPLMLTKLSLHTQQNEIENDRNLAAWSGMTNDEHKGPHVRSVRSMTTTRSKYTRVCSFHVFHILIFAWFSMFLNSRSCWNNSKQAIFALASWCTVPMLHQTWSNVISENSLILIAWNPFFVKMILAKQGSKCRSGRPVKLGDTSGRRKPGKSAFWWFVATFFDLQQQQRGTH